MQEQASCCNVRWQVKTYVERDKSLQVKTRVLEPRRLRVNTKEVVSELRRMLGMINQVPEGSGDSQDLDDLISELFRDIESLAEDLEATDAE